MTEQPLIIEAENRRKTMSGIKKINYCLSLAMLVFCSYLKKKKSRGTSGTMPIPDEC